MIGTPPTRTMLAISSLLKESVQMSLCLAQGTEMGLVMALHRQTTPKCQLRDEAQLNNNYKYSRLLLGHRCIETQELGFNPSRVPQGF